MKLLEELISQDFRKFKTGFDFCYDKCRPLLYFNNFLILLKEQRNHPVIIWFCLSLTSMLASAYNNICYQGKSGTGIFTLTSRQCCRYYENFIMSKRGLIDALSGTFENLLGKLA